MSALARYYQAKGYEVFGYDKTKTELTDALQTSGMSIHYEDALSLIPEGLEMVVYTPAIPKTHQQLSFLQAQSNVPVLKRAEVLGLLSRDHVCYALAGTHGKTTSSVMLSWLLKHGGMAINAFLGGIARDFDSNFLLGDRAEMVVEADEFDRSFLHLSPAHAAILSMDADHLDIYGASDAMIDEGFNAFVDKIQSGGVLLYNVDFEKVVKKRDDLKNLSFGIEMGDVRARNIRVEAGCFVFDYQDANRSMQQIKLALPGLHNIKNALVAIYFALHVGVSEANIRTGLASFGGIKRRFDRVWQGAQTIYIDDYAHHPTELTAAISAARDLFPDRKLTGIFQPHLYSRTRDFLDGFAAALDQLDKVLLLDIYPARELPIPGILSERIAEKMRLKTEVLPKEKVLNWLNHNPPEVLLTLGAGDIDTLVAPIKNLLQKQEKLI